jgi:hypothetical protein
MHLADIHILLQRAEIALAQLPGPTRFLATENRDSEGRGARTDFRDENLEVKIPAASGESTEERQRERLSEPTCRILDAPDAAIQSKLVSSRCHGDRCNDPSRSVL